ncbi:hypothetical protein ET33_04625 [Paenibacillus tyrfis]|uniref:Uncharacterized protein n=1 Tax=Paenibacillus tyrfis TaxID=1501230 RepID=A0A081P2R6_9BACL|nr:hypothetical protein ET33_04625 [Paenibacillus tyrfis]
MIPPCAGGAGCSGAFAAGGEEHPALAAKVAAKNRLISFLFPAADEAFGLEGSCLFILIRSHSKEITN